jgi:hypothetical protein
LSDVSIENVEALAEEWPSENGQTAMIMDCYDSRGNRKGTRRLCFSPGYSTNCTSTSC